MGSATYKNLGGGHKWQPEIGKNDFWGPFRWFILQLWKGDDVLTKVKKGEKTELS